ncbi:MAG: DNA mismatch repair protein MutS [Deltaproteobacteria bacterium]|jgi:DNA-nicking Smr family endonuclease|nr:DNA mismatch repair protein MutS [Deltaproteobacteria bacterium]
MKDNAFNQPFKEAEARLRRIKVAPGGKPAAAGVRLDRDTPENEEALFRVAMADVVPMAGDRRDSRRPVPSGPVQRPDDHDRAETLAALRRLVVQGEGYSVSDTPEYMEGTGYRFPLEWARRLHRGDFPVQDHIDLHGYTMTAAQPALETFLLDAIAAGRQSLLVIHGRGLSSPREPVLKNMVKDWLTRRSWRKWIIAFASARPCDGGAGATYVLLRPHGAPPHRRFPHRSRRSRRAASARET